MVDFLGDSKKYYYEVQELITFISINIPNITFTIEELQEAISLSGMNQLEKTIFKKWLENNISDENITLQVRGFSDNNDITYKIFDMNSKNWNEIIPLGLEPIFRACNIEYVLDLSGIKDLNQVNFDEARKYIDLDILKLKYDIEDLDIADENEFSSDIEIKEIENDIELINNTDKDEIEPNKPIDYSDIEEKYKENTELLENLKKLREMNIL